VLRPSRRRPLSLSAGAAVNGVHAGAANAHEHTPAVAVSSSCSNTARSAGPLLWDLALQNTDN